MSNIPISQIVQINPRVIGAGSAQGALDGLLLTDSDAIRADVPTVFYSAQDVTAVFGVSPESEAAAVYFAGIQGGGQQPRSLTFARYIEDGAVGATVFGASLNATLADLQALSGTLNVTTDVAHNSANISLAGATSFAEAAALMEAGFTVPNFTIEWDAARSRFVATTTQTGAAARITGFTGSLAASVGLAVEAGAQVQATGVDTDSPASAMDRVTAASTSWAVFALTFDVMPDVHTAFAAWAAQQDSQYLFVCHSLAVDGLTPNNPASFGAQVKAVPYSGTLPLYGDLNEAAGVLAWAASTNFDVTSGRNTLAFRTPLGGLPARVTSLADANALLSNGYTYLGSYAATGSAYTIYYGGEVGGQFGWSDTFINQVWLRRSLQQALFDTLLAYNSLPYNAEGYAAIYQGAQAVVSQALANGVIRAGVDLSASQRAQIDTQAGAPVAGEVVNQGWHLQVTDPLNPATRTVRGSPTVNFWYSDGGSIQKIVVSSTTVL